MAETIKIGDLKPQLAIIPYRVKVDEDELVRLSGALSDRWNSPILTNPTTGALRKDVADVRVIETWSEGYWHATAAYYALERPPQWLKRVEKAKKDERPPLLNRVYHVVLGAFGKNFAAFS
jgi:hypothetical protein